MLEIAFHLAVAVDVFDCVLFCAVLLSYETSWMRSGTKFSQFLKIFLSTITMYRKTHLIL